MLKSNVCINIDLAFYDESEYIKLVDKFMNKQKKISFEDLNKIMHLSERKYVAAEMEIPELNNDDTIIKNVSIRIVG